MSARPSSRTILGTVAATVFVLFAGACAVPFAPGYQILKQTFDVRFVPGPSPQLSVHNVYTLQNSGTAPLDFIEAIFPSEKTYGRTSLHVGVEGQVVSPESLPPEYQAGSPGAQRLPFASPWLQKEKRELVVDYIFASPSESGADVALSPESFYLGTRGWLPILLPPKRILAPSPARPPQMTYSVSLPNSFTIVARGSAGGRKQNGNDTTHRFELTKDDLAPFIVAGHYASSSEAIKSGAIFWLNQSLPQNSAASQARIAAAWNALQKNFGMLGKRNEPPYVVESPALHSEAGDPAAAFVGFPRGALVNPAAIALGFESAVFTENVDRELARSWFGDALTAASAAAVALGEGLPNYATTVIAEATGGDLARRKRILELLTTYDNACKQLTAPEKAVVATTSTDSIDQRRLADAKAPLLFISLEDTYGSGPVRAGLSQAIQILRGKEVTVNDVRAAIEYTTGKNLAEPFRVWLYNPGIPASFRARYGEAAGTGK